jgi:hypothetical protein
MLGVVGVGLVGVLAGEIA